MEDGGCTVIFNEEEFVEFVFGEQGSLHNLPLVDGGSIEAEILTVDDSETANFGKRRPVEHGGVKTSSKTKRRGNLTEFGDNLPNKRKNESAKRELTSIVNQVSSFYLYISNRIVNQNVV